MSIARAVREIWKDILDRRGLKWEAEKVSATVRNKEIFPAWEAIISRHIDGELSELRTTVAFFASVIKSGESWSPTCEEALRKAFPPKKEDAAR